MLVPVILPLLLLSAVMSVVFIVYIWLLWLGTDSRTDGDNSGSPVGEIEKGLTVPELDKLPRVTGKELVLGTDCAICLREVEAEQPARLVPGCNHGYHLECADTWLSKHPVCPLCRAGLKL